jgi:hypothetical protein
MRSVVDFRFELEIRVEHLQVKLSSATRNEFRVVTCVTGIDKLVRLCK